MAIGVTDALVNVSGDFDIAGKLRADARQESSAVSRGPRRY